MIVAKRNAETKEISLTSRRAHYGLKAGEVVVTEKQAEKYGLAGGVTISKGGTGYAALNTAISKASALQPA